jgi:hypothetical protein
MINTCQQVGGSVSTSLLGTILANAVSTYTASHLHTTGLANAVAVHGDTTAFWCSAGTFVLAFLLATVILQGQARRAHNQGRAGPPRDRQLSPDRGRGSRPARRSPPASHDRMPGVAHCHGTSTRKGD